MRLLRAHASISREFNRGLLEDHGLTINDYEVLLHLAKAPDRSLRRVDLVERINLTASGVTRLLDGLQASGHVRKRSCDSDARVTYAELTDAGVEKLRQASDTHLEAVEALFRDRYTKKELEVLSRLLGKLPGAEGPVDEGSCSV